MDFIFTLQPKDNAGKIATGNGEFVVRVPIGYDQESGDVFSVFAALASYPGGGSGKFEFVFNLLRSDSAGEEIDWYWDGAETKFLLADAERRKMVFSELCEMLSVLIEASHASCILMMTHTAHLPQKALVKFQKLVVILRNEGFDARAVDTAHGNHMWIAIR